MAWLIIASLIIGWFFIKVAAEVNMRLIIKTAVKGVFLETVVVDKIDIYIGMALTNEV